MRLFTSAHQLCSLPGRLREGGLAPVCGEAEGGMVEVEAGKPLRIY